MMKYVDKKIDEEYITNVLGTGTPSDPVVAFVDKQCVIFYEQWSTEGRWRGWRQENLEPVEYFRRKLKGK